MASISSKRKLSREHPAKQAGEATGSIGKKGMSGSPRTLALIARVHMDAFAAAPGAYLQGVAWRLRGLRVRSKNRLAALKGRSPHAYALWMARHEPRIVERYLENAPASAVPIYVLVDCSSTSGDTQRTLKSVERQRTAHKIVVVGGEPLEGYCQVPPESLSDMLVGEGWVCVLQPGDELARHALAAYRTAIEHHSDADLIYADDDLLREGERGLPHFKPDWNAELFRHHDFISNACIVRLRSNLLPAKLGDDWSKAVRDSALSSGTAPRHLPLILHHRARRNSPLLPGSQKVMTDGPEPLVTVIIPTRNKADLLGKCLEGLNSVDYPNLEVIVVDNGSDEPATIGLLAKLEADGTRVLRRPGPFNYSELNNFAVSQARGEFLCFLNNDVEMVDGGWLRIMVDHAAHPDRGAVGARLLYPDGTIQHAGVVTGIGGGAGHAHRFQRSDEEGYFQRARLPQRVSAVTAACLVVEREKFLSVGGFDPELFPVAFNDVDLCLKLNANGWQSFYEPRATLIHHESKSRGSDSLAANRERFAGELAELKRKWRTDEERDPYHHACLSPFTEQFLIAV